MSEHTAEFYIVPRFRTILEMSFSCALPMYFWKSREGTPAARLTLPDAHGRLVALFARRPKYPTREHITMKINAEVFEDAARMRAMGIPTFVGAPLVSSFFELARDFDCIWFFIQAMEGAHPDFYFLSATPANPDSRVRGPLEEEHICQIVGNEGQVMSWEEAFDRMSDVRAARNAFDGRFVFGPNYKPVYFLIPDTSCNDR